MCDCSSNKDKTHSDVFDFVSTKKINIFTASDFLGIGVFSIPDPEAGILERKTVYVENISYVETTKRGFNCFEFQWIPYGINIVRLAGNNLTINTLTDLLEASRDCTSWRCSPSGCMMPCFCRGNETGYCHR
ncbi:hypothetical protein [Citrobacter murliniae]